MVANPFVDNLKITLNILRTNLDSMNLPAKSSLLMASIESLVSPTPQQLTNLRLLVRNNSNAYQASDIFDASDFLGVFPRTRRTIPVEDINSEAVPEDIAMTLMDIYHFFLDAKFKIINGAGEYVLRWETGTSVVHNCDDSFMNLFNKTVAAIVSPDIPYGVSFDYLKMYFTDGLTVAEVIEHLVVTSLSHDCSKMLLAVQKVMFLFELINTPQIDATAITSLNDSEVDYDQISETILRTEVSLKAILLEYLPTIRSSVLSNTTSLASVSSRIESTLQEYLEYMMSSLTSHLSQIVQTSSNLLKLENGVLSLNMDLDNAKSEATSLISQLLDILSQVQNELTGLNDDFEKVVDLTKAITERTNFEKKTRLDDIAVGSFAFKNITEGLSNIKELAKKETITEETS